MPSSQLVPVADHQVVEDADLALGRLFFLVLGGGLLGRAAPGITSAAKAILSPRGDQIGPETSIGSFVSCRASPPSSGSSQTCDDPPRLEANAIDLAVGAPARVVVRTRARWSAASVSPPEVDTSHRLLFVLSVARSSSETT